MRFARLTTVCLALVFAACGGSSPTGSNDNNPPQNPPPPAGGKNVTIKDFSFSPETVTVTVGSKVQWVNNGATAHHVVSDDDVWDSGSLSSPTGSDPYGDGGSAGQSYQFEFTTAGTYKYHCENHPPSAYPNFVGVVVVTP
jgi:plastocyanin